MCCLRFSRVGVEDEVVVVVVVPRCKQVDKQDVKQMAMPHWSRPPLSHDLFR